MRDLLIIHEPGMDQRMMDQLAEAGQARGLAIRPVDASRGLPDLDQRMLYPVVRTAFSRRSFLLQQTLFKQYHCVSVMQQSCFPYQNAFPLSGVPFPKTVTLRENDPRPLEDLVAQVGGFPVVVKGKLAGGHGVGVIRVASQEALSGTMRMMRGPGRAEPLLLQANIPHRYNARLIVLGDEILVALAYYTNPYDFRTNRSLDEIQVERIDFPKPFADAAIAASRAAGLAFSGVDILEGSGGLYVTEANYPCNFLVPQRYTDVPIAARVIDYLIEQGRKCLLPAEAILSQAAVGGMIPDSTDETAACDSDGDSNGDSDSKGNAISRQDPQHDPQNDAPEPAPQLHLIADIDGDAMTRALMRSRALAMGLEIREIPSDIAPPELTPGRRHLIVRLSRRGRNLEMALFKQGETLTASLHSARENRACPPNSTPNAETPWPLCRSSAGHYAVLSAESYNRNSVLKQADVRYLHRVTLNRQRHKNHEALLKVLDEIGQFPLLVRYWGEGENGFLRVDDSPAAISTVDYLFALGRGVSLQPYLRLKRAMRLVVLGDAVIASVGYLSRDPHGYPFAAYDAIVAMPVADEIAQQAVKAAQALGLEFAAVNVLITRDDLFYIEEILHPFPFAREWNASGVDIAALLLRHLLTTRPPPMPRAVQHGTPPSTETNRENPS